MNNLNRVYKCDIIGLGELSFNGSKCVWTEKTDSVSSRYGIYIDIGIPISHYASKDTSKSEFIINLSLTDTSIYASSDTIKVCCTFSRSMPMTTATELTSIIKIASIKQSGQDYVYNSTNSCFIESKGPLFTSNIYNLTKKHRLYIFPSSYNSYNSTYMYDTDGATYPLELNINNIDITVTETVEYHSEYIEEYYITYHNGPLSNIYHSILNTDIFTENDVYNIRNNMKPHNYSNSSGKFSDVALCQSTWGGFVSNGFFRINCNINNEYTDLLYYASCLKFTTTDFNGICDSIEFAIQLYKTTTTDVANIRYALCTSDINRVDYINAISEVTDKYQISSGLLENVEGLHTFSISNNTIKANTIYYLFLWPDESSTNGLNIAGSLNSSSFNIKYTPEDALSAAETNFTIKGIANGGVNDIVLTATKIDRTRYTFLGWDMEESATTVQYKAGEEITLTDFHPSSNTMDLYAVWEPIYDIEYKNNTLDKLEDATRSSVKNDTYTVILDNNDGITNPVTHVVDSIIEYHFRGWADTLENANNKIALLDSTEFVSDTEVFAIWDEEIVTDSIDLPTFDDSHYETQYNINLNPNNGSVDISTVTAKRTKDYEFLGWGTSKNTVLYVSDPFIPTKDTTLYANWNIISTDYPVELPNPNRAVHLFLGWATDINDPDSYVYSPYIPDDGSETDVTLYAKWEPRYIAQPCIYHNGKWCKSEAVIRFNDSFNICI